MLLVISESLGAFIDMTLLLSNPLPRDIPNKITSSYQM
jgi:hypothetical protein